MSEKLSESEKIKLTMNASMRSWWPVVQDLDIPMPKTVVLPLEREETIALHWMTENPIPNKLKERIITVANFVGYPMFLRTDQTACKHNWEDTCYVKKEDLFSHIFELIDYSSCIGLTGLPTYGLVFREFIEMDSKFTAFDGMPVSPERRYFAEDGKVLCHHHYWIEDAIEFRGREHPENWKELLRDMNEEKDEVELLTKYSEMISQRLTKYMGGAWSIDFCKGKDGVYRFIDCAPAEISWHPEDCEVK